MATGCSRRCHRRRRRRASLPMKDMRLARQRHSLAAAGYRRTSLRPRSSAAGRSDGLGTKSRKENDRASFEERSFPALDRPRPRRFRLPLLDRRPEVALFDCQGAARAAAAAHDVAGNTKGEQTERVTTGAIVPERTLAYYVELFLVSLSTTPYYTTDEEYYIFVIHPYTTLFWVRRRS